MGNGDDNEDIAVIPANEQPSTTVIDKGKKPLRPTLTAAAVTSLSSPPSPSSLSPKAPSWHEEPLSAEGTMMFPTSEANTSKLEIAFDLYKLLPHKIRQETQIVGLEELLAEYENNKESVPNSEVLTTNYTKIVQGISQLTFRGNPETELIKIFIWRTRYPKGSSGGYEGKYVKAVFEDIWARMPLSTRDTLIQDDDLFKIAIDSAIQYHSIDILDFWISKKRDTFTPETLELFIKQMIVGYEDALNKEKNIYEQIFEKLLMALSSNAGLDVRKQFYQEILTFIFERRKISNVMLERTLESHPDKKLAAESILAYILKNEISASDRSIMIRIAFKFCPSQDRSKLFNETLLKSLQKNVSTDPYNVCTQLLAMEDRPALDQEHMDAILVYAEVNALVGLSKDGLANAYRDGNFSITPELFELLRELHRNNQKQYPPRETFYEKMQRQLTEIAKTDKIASMKLFYPIYLVANKSCVSLYEPLKAAIDERRDEMVMCLINDCPKEQKVETVQKTLEAVVDADGDPQIIEDIFLICNKEERKQILECNNNELLCQAIALGAAGECKSAVGSKIIALYAAAEVDYKPQLDHVFSITAEKWIEARPWYLSLDSIMFISLVVGFAAALSLYLGEVNVVTEMNLLQDEDQSALLKSSATTGALAFLVVLFALSVYAAYRHYRFTATAHMIIATPGALSEPDASDTGTLTASSDDAFSSAHSTSVPGQTPSS